jgi:hypothetical protein
MRDDPLAELPTCQNTDAGAAASGQVVLVLAVPDGRVGRPCGLHVGGVARGGRGAYCLHRPTLGSAGGVRSDQTHGAPSTRAPLFLRRYSLGANCAQACSASAAYISAGPPPMYTATFSVSSNSACVQPRRRSALT